MKAKKKSKIKEYQVISFLKERARTVFDSLGENKKKILLA
jgi:hypothetical protein